MKILYLYRELYNRRRRYGNLLEQLGHAVCIYHVSKKPELLSLKYLMGFDLIWCYKPSLLKKVCSKDVLRGIKSKNICVVTYNAASKDPAENYAYFDYVFIHNRYFANKLKLMYGNKFAYMPMGFYKEDYYPNKEMAKTISLSFMGGITASKNEDMRVGYLSKILNEMPIKIYGKKLCSTLGIKKISYKTHEEQRCVYWKTKVNLGLPFTSKNYDCVIHQKNRFFEVPACGEILLTKYSEELAELFEPDNEVIYYNSYEELVDKAKYIIKNYNKLQHIKDNAYQRSITDHQYIYRFRDMMKIIEREKR